MVVIIQGENKSIAAVFPNRNYRLTEVKIILHTSRGRGYMYTYGYTCVPQVEI